MFRGGISRRIGITTSPRGGIVKTNFSGSPKGEDSNAPGIPVIVLSNTNPNPGDTVNILSITQDGQGYTPTSPTYAWRVDGTVVSTTNAVTLDSATDYDSDVGKRLQLTMADASFAGGYSSPQTDPIGLPGPLTQAPSFEVLEDGSYAGQLVARSPIGLSLTFRLNTDGTDGTAVVNADGSFTYTPDVGSHVGTDSFTFDVEDSIGNLNVATTVSMTVLEIPRVTSATVEATGSTDPVWTRNFALATLGANATFTGTAGENVTDYFGVTHTGLANEPRFENARRGAVNLFTDPVSTLSNGSSTTGVSVTPGVYVFRMGAGSGTATFSGTADGSTGAIGADASNPTSQHLLIIGSGTIIVTASVADLSDIQLEETTTNKMPFVPSEFNSAAFPPYYTYENGNTVAEGHGTALLSGDTSTLDSSLGDWVWNSNGSITYNATDKAVRQTAVLASKFEAMLLEGILTAATDYRVRMRMRRSHTTDPNNWDMMYRVTGGSGSWGPFAQLLPNDGNWHWVEFTFNTGAGGDDFEVAQNVHTAIGDWFEIGDCQIWPYTAGNDSRVVTETQGPAISGDIKLLKASTDSLSYSGVQPSNELRSVTDTGTVDVDNWDGDVDNALLGGDNSGSVTSIDVYDIGGRDGTGSQTPTLTINFSRDTVNTGGFVLTKKDAAPDDPIPVALSNLVDGSSTLTAETGFIYSGQLVYLSNTDGNVVDANNARPLASFTDLAVTNNSTVTDPGAGGGPLGVTQSSTIPLTSSDDPNTYDGFRVYIGSETTPRYQGPGPSITFSQLNPQLPIGTNTLHVRTYNAIDESPATPSVEFNMT